MEDSFETQERAMTNQELPDYCFVFHWGAVRIAVLSRTAMLTWGAALAALCTGVGLYKLLALL
jgi:hypothetical protein